MKEILLDTNAYTRFTAGDENILNALAKAQTVYMSVFVPGELYAGFRGGTKAEENTSLLKKISSEADCKSIKCNPKNSGDIRKNQEQSEKSGRTFAN